MDPALKEYLDAWFARRQHEFDALLRAMQGTAAGGVTGPVTASSDTTEVVLASVELADPPAQPPTTEKTPVVAPSVPSDTIIVSPATCSTEGPSSDATEPAPAFIPAAAPTSPTVTADVIPVLAVAAAGDTTLDGEPIKGAASTAATSSSGSPNSGVITSVCAFISSTTPSLSVASPAPTPTEVSDTRLLQPFSIQVFGALAPVKRSTACLNDAWEVLAYVLSDEFPQKDEVQQQPWPPPPEFCETSLRDELQELFGNAASFGLQTCSSNGPRGTTRAAMESQMLQLLGNLSSSVSCIMAKGQYSDRERWSFNDLLLRVQECVQHACVLSYAPSCHERHTTAILLSVLVNDSVLTLLLSGSPHSCWVADKYCITVTCATTLYDPMFDWYISMHIQWLSIGVRHTVCKSILAPTMFSFTLFQWEIAWQLEGSKNYATDNLTIDGKEILITWSLPNIYCCNPSALQSYNETMDSELVCYYQLSKGKEASKFYRVAVLELQRSAYSLFSAATCQTRKVQSNKTFSSFDHCQLGMYFKVGHLSYHVVQHTTRGASRCGGVAIYSRSCTCTDMKSEQSQGNGELIQWLTHNIVGAYLIWWVAWTVNVLEFSTGCGQAPFQGGRDVIRAAFSDQVHVNHHDYIACANQILFDYDYYLNQACYFDKGCNDIISYRDDYHGDSSKTKEVLMPWDPGTSVLHYHPMLRLGDKPNFKEGGMLGTYLYSSDTHAWAGLLGRQWAWSGNDPSCMLHNPGRRQRSVHPCEDHELAAAANPLPTSALDLSLFMLLPF